MIENDDFFAPLDDRPDINVPEFLDLIAEAARTSRHAGKAYALLRDAIPDLEPLPMRQALIAGRMGEAA